MLGRCDMMPCLVMKVFLVCKHLFSFCWHLCKSHCKCFAECILLELSKISSKVCWENLFAVGARNIGQNFGESGLAFSVSAHQLGCHCWISIFSYLWKTTRNRFVAGLWLEFQSMSGTIRVENQAKKKRKHPLVLPDWKSLKEDWILISWTFYTGRQVLMALNPVSGKLLSWLGSWNCIMEPWMKSTNCMWINFAFSAVYQNCRRFQGRWNQCS